ncbi:MAG TPA: efflux RND transporter periplasmic adaptor subunit [Bryobacteraceae bacterium]|jgi:multidrug resistance efflux pump|nr:efflux RND transporter periplasmic adaptor subunit [Bryobacteraceae bacterium]
MRGKWVLISGSLILAAVAAGALSLLRKESHQKPEAPRPAPAAATMPDKEVSLPGKVLAQHVVTVGDQVSGTVDSFLADVGQDVFEGQLLARLTNQGLEAARESASQAVENAQERVNKIEADLIAFRLEASRARADAVRSRAEYERAERTYRRQQMLNNAGATPRLTYERSEHDFDKAQRDFDSLDTLARQAEGRIDSRQEELENARKILDDKKRQLEDIQINMQGMEVHSPVTGVVLNRQGEVGKLHEDGTAMFEIAADLSLLQVAVEPEPPMLARIRPGQPALIFVADLQGAIPGTVKDIQNTVVHVVFTSPTAVLRPGVTAQVRIRLEDGT